MSDLGQLTPWPLLAAKLYNTPLLIEPSKAEVLARVFQAHSERRESDLPPFEAKPHVMPAKTTRADGGYLLTDGGVAILQVHGTLVQRASGMDALSGMTGYNRLSAQLQAALADPQVRGVLLEVDSPGGEAAGMFDLAAQIHAASKPVMAHANEMAFSAAYGIASAAKQGLYLPTSGMVGSVGVVMMHVDQSGQDAKRGLVYTPIFAGAKKVDFSSHAPLSEAARADAQAQVDRLYQLFVGQVALTRGIDEAVVRGTEAGLLAPEQALAVRMADGTATFAEAIQRLTDAVAAPSFTGFSTRRAGAHSQEGAIMAEGSNAPANTAAHEHDQKPAAAAPVDTAKLAAEARAQERKRIAAITSHEEAVGREKLAQHIASNTEMDVDSAIAMLKASPKEAAPAAAASDQFAAHMAKTGNAKVTADAGATGDKPSAAAPIAANIYAFRKQCVMQSRKAG